LEPFTYYDVMVPEYQVTGAYLLNLYQVEKEPGLVGPVCDTALLEKLLLAKESRVEDLSLQSLTQHLTIFDARAQLSSARQALQQREEELQQELHALRAQLHDTQAQLHNAQGQLQDTQAAFAAYTSSRLVRLAHKLARG
jgi:hypothetical protein